MEYGWFTDYLADNMPAPLNTDKDFVAFMKGNPAMNSTYDQMIF